MKRRIISLVATSMLTNVALGLFLSEQVDAAQQPVRTVVATQGKAKVKSQSKASSKPVVKTVTAKKSSKSVQKSSSKQVISTSSTARPAASAAAISTPDAALLYVCQNFQTLMSKPTTATEAQQLAAIYASQCPLVLGVVGKMPVVEDTLADVLATNRHILHGTSRRKGEFTIASGGVLLSTSKKINVRLAQNLTIKTADGSAFDPATFVTQEEGTPKEYRYRIGVSGQHLIFSQPLPITLQTDLPHGKIVDLLVQHEGEQMPGKAGLTLNPNAVCRADGTVSKSDQAFSAVALSGVVTFYSCGASTFIMNPVGGTAGSQDLKIHIGDYGQVQIYYNNLTQIFGGNPPGAGGGGPSAWPILVVGTNVIGNNIGAAWTTGSTTGQQVGNLYTAITTLRYTTGALTYTAVINWSYTAPDKYFTWTYNITIPSGNTKNVKFYYGMDSYVAGADAADVGYMSTGNGLTVGIYDNVANVLSAQRYMTGRAWSGYEAAPYGTISSRITSRANFNNTVTGATAGDNGYGINWDFGTGTSGTFTSTTEWRLVPYVSTNVPDIIPGVGQPTPTLAVGVTSYIPLTTTNVGLTGSTGQHLARMTIASGVNGPTTGFTSSGWNCGAMVTTGRTVTCTKTVTIASLGVESLSVPVIPTTGTQGQYLRFTGYVFNSGDSNLTNNTGFITLQVAVMTGPLAITSFSLSGTSVNESQVTGTYVGTFSTVDPNTGATLTYTFDTGCVGSTGDNSKFSISGNQLLTNTVFNYALQTGAKICARTTDQRGMFKTGAFNITIISIGTVTITAPTGLTGNSISTSLSSQTWTQTFNATTGQAFMVHDTKGANSGYLATLQISGNLVSTTGGFTIASGNVGIMGTPAVFVISGSANPLVQPSSGSITPFRPLSSIQNLIWRNVAPNSGVRGSYGVYLPLQINIPAAQPAGTYVGTLVFTVIEN